MKGGHVPVVTALALCELSVLGATAYYLNKTEVEQAVLKAAAETETLLTYWTSDPVRREQFIRELEKMTKLCHRQLELFPSEVGNGG